MRRRFGYRRRAHPVEAQRHADEPREATLALPRCRAVGAAQARPHARGSRTPMPLPLLPRGPVHDCRHRHLGRETGPRDRNAVRPHSSLGNLTLLEAAGRLRYPRPPCPARLPERPTRLPFSDPQGPVMNGGQKGAPLHYSWIPPLSRFSGSWQGAGMVDIVDAGTRSWMMSNIRGKNTKPELALRRSLHAQGFRFRLHVKHLPGKPDLVFSKYRAAVFVHGCFWHRHPGCRYATMPKTRMEFWEKKFAANISRDTAASEELIKKGWRVAIVWECALRNPETLSRTARKVAVWFRSDEPEICIPPFDLPRDSSSMLD